MVCCALIALILAGLIWPLRALIGRRKTPALQWRPITIETEMDSPVPFSLAARAKSFGYAFDGLEFVVRNEHNARIHLVAAAGIVALGLVLQVTSTDWLILVIAIASVWFAETINTAFEHLCDVVSPEKNESVKKSKDIAAGGVLIAASGAAIVGALVLLPYVPHLFAHSKIV